MERTLTLLVYMIQKISQMTIRNVLTVIDKFLFKSTTSFFNNMIYIFSYFHFKKKSFCTQLKLYLLLFNNRLKIICEYQQHPSIRLEAYIKHTNLTNDTNLTDANFGQG